MSFEERIDRLAERHEALAQSLELMRIDSEAQMRKLEVQARNIELLRESAADLLKVARMHESRISRLEGQP